MEAAIDLETIATAVLSGRTTHFFFSFIISLKQEKTTDLSQGTDQLYPIINDLRLDVDVALGNIDGVFTRHSLSFLFANY
jgi:hypothetical protein